MVNHRKEIQCLGFELLSLRWGVIEWTVNKIPVNNSVCYFLSNLLENYTNDQECNEIIFMDSYLITKRHDYITVFSD